MALPLIALALGAFVIGTSETAVMGLLPEMTRDFGVPVGQGGHIIAAYALGVVLGAPALTALTIRLSRKLVLVGALALFLAGNLAVLMAPDLITVLVARFLTGLPHGLFLGAATILATRIARPGQQATAVARVLIGTTTANIIGLPAATFLGQVFGWRTAFAVVTVLAVLALIAVAVFTPSVTTREPVNLRRETRSLGKAPVVLALSTTVVVMAGLMMVYCFIAPILSEGAGVPSNSVPIVLALYGIGTMLGALVIGPLADRALRPALYTALVLLTVTLLVFRAAMGSPWLAMGALVLLGIAAFSVNTCVQLLVIRAGGTAPTMAAAVNHSAFSLATTAASVLGGAALGFGLDYTALPVIGAVVVLAGLAVAVAAGRSARRVPTIVIESPAPARAVPALEYVRVIDQTGHLTPVSAPLAPASL
ncbi:MFS transporter [Bogoriella caseilytica]|uniref:DHA1 family inner membrane transport protein n=1 Tax=Bogoriella caseilytica TaxID=56055 RepID=A0A3N2BCQ4_9MICO|nr:MFS transporter [Bogoriella caseilytica]ROR73037.1 DHA1 family inner membrane transport protein [Bogoriella caseilytica]